MKTTINDPQLRASADALETAKPRRRLSLDEMSADIRALEAYLGRAWAIRASVMTSDGVHVAWGKIGRTWRIAIIGRDLRPVPLLEAPTKARARAFPHLVDLVRLIGELAREAGE